MSLAFWRNASEANDVPKTCVVFETATVQCMYIYVLFYVGVCHRKYVCMHIYMYTIFVYTVYASSHPAPIMIHLQESAGTGPIQLWSASDRKACGLAKLIKLTFIMCVQDCRHLF